MESRKTIMYILLALSIAFACLSTFLFFSCDHALSEKPLNAVRKAASNGEIKIELGNQSITCKVGEELPKTRITMTMTADSPADAIFWGIWGEQTPTEWCNAPDGITVDIVGTYENGRQMVIEMYGRPSSPSEEDISIKVPKEILRGATADVVTIDNPAARWEIKDEKAPEIKINISNQVVFCKVGEEVSKNTIYLTMTDDTPADVIFQGLAFTETEWFNAPPGVEVNVIGTYQDGRQAVIKMSGKPQTSSKEDIFAIIPKEYLRGATSDVKTIDNPQSRFNITGDVVTHTHYLIIKFDVDIAGFSSKNIKIDGIEIGDVTRTGVGTYEALIKTDVDCNEEVEVVIVGTYAKPDRMTVQIHCDDEIYILSIQDNFVVSGWQNHKLNPEKYNGKITINDGKHTWNDSACPRNLSPWFNDPNKVITGMLIMSGRIEDDGKSLYVTFSGTPTVVGKTPFSLTVPSGYINDVSMETKNIRNDTSWIEVTPEF